MRIYLETTGCRLNQSEVEAMARQFRRAGHELVSAAGEADLCVVNTCAVTRQAAGDSRGLIRRLNRANPSARIVATGCYAQLAPQAVGDLPGVAQIVSNLDKDRLVPLTLGADAAAAPFDAEPLACDFAAGALGRTRAFVKAQDGCDNRCTFCVTTLARGPGRSRPLDEVTAEIRALAAAGYQEAVLTGVHLGSYGRDHGERDGLARLVRAVLERTPIVRLRLSSLEPWDLAPDFFALWENPRLCRHLHLPLQSGCDATLRRMGRRTSQTAFGALVESARAQIPDLALSTDVIVGFPGETEDEFAQSAAFVRSLDFMKLHVFRYSARPGTAAARMPGHVPPAAMKARSAALLVLSDEGARRYAARWLGREVEVLWEQAAGAQNSGLTDTYLRVHMSSLLALTNTLTRVRVVGLAEGGGVLAEPLAARRGWGAR